MKTFILTSPEGKRLDAAKAMTYREAYEYFATQWALTLQHIIKERHNATRN